MVATFTAEPTAQTELERVLNLADEVIRHKVMLLPETKPTAEARSEDARRQAASPAPRRATTGADGARDTERGTAHMASDNQITIVGNLTDDPELRYTPNGAAVGKFRIAVTARIPDARRQLEGRRNVVLHGQLLAQPRRERGRVAHARHARRGRRAAQLPLLGEPGRRQAHRRRDRGRRGRPEPASGRPPRVERQSRSSSRSRRRRLGRARRRARGRRRRPTRRHHWMPR